PPPFFSPSLRDIPPDRHYTVSQEIPGVFIDARARGGALELIPQFLLREGQGRKWDRLNFVYGNIPLGMTPSELESAFKCALKTSIERSRNSANSDTGKQIPKRKIMHHVALAGDPFCAESFPPRVSLKTDVAELAPNWDSQGLTFEASWLDSGDDRNSVREQIYHDLLELCSLSAGRRFSDLGFTGESRAESDLTHLTTYRAMLKTAVNVTTWLQRHQDSFSPVDLSSATNAIQSCAEPTDSKHVLSSGYLANLSYQAGTYKDAEHCIEFIQRDHDSSWCILRWYGDRARYLLSLPFVLPNAWPRITQVVAPTRSKVWHVERINLTKLPWERHQPHLTVDTQRILRLDGLLHPRDNPDAGA
ncbi:MAG TPA: hypothetical protein PKA37_09425, partial [Planctomycetota bacterium]|nr:hypothetical protein [Planctomycetota bacterium]